MTSTQPHATDRPSREECLRAAGRVVLNIAIRVELDRLATLQAARASQTAA
ncbi:hypothetical protein [Leifsonia aquatica]|uniref:hypothetical protein n=1 Tax=Leifsonia aquatica TaxID=144185 RepID=UPI0038197F4D